MNIYDAFETDVNCIRDGVWFDIEFPRGVVIARIKCRPMDATLNLEYQALLAEHALLPVPSSEEEKDERTAELFSRCCIVDWQDVTDRNGNPMACTPENIRKLVTDLPKVADVVLVNARRWEHYRRKFVDDTVGN